MVMANAKPPRKVDILKARKAVNEKPATGQLYPLEGFGGGKVMDRGLKHSGIDWKNR